MKIHHNTLKRAKKFGIELTVNDNEIVARKGGTVLAAGLAGNKVLDEAIAALDGPARKAKSAGLPGAPKKKKAPRKARNEDGGEEGEEEEDDSKEIVKKKYKDKYKPFKMTCGDALATRLLTYLKVKVDGEERVDAAKLKAFAQANGCWDPGYASLNVGMRRMVIVNRLRGKVRRDKHQIVWP